MLGLPVPGFRHHVPVGAFTEAGRKRGAPAGRNRARQPRSRDRPGNGRIGRLRRLGQLGRQAGNTASARPSSPIRRKATRSISAALDTSKRARRIHVRLAQGESRPFGANVRICQQRRSGVNGHLANIWLMPALPPCAILRGNDLVFPRAHCTLSATRLCKV